MTRRTRVTLWLYPFGAGAAGVNLFFASLILSWVDVPLIPPIWSFLGGMIIGIPATHLFAGHIVRLMEQAERA
ncbi:NnrT protein [Cereibacter sphaeroides]|uniref:NnrT protein n=1 Tax=Rhodobacterales TaxID=204455 RepID=UPI000BBF25FD|nr:MULTISPECIES: NnrT protein [Paracoccaceae]MCE6950943.1 NnrT protein [Cereibacter sphaeroides]MCE6960473.1 NnrT protein [Cereibacter sphaeroides]MCE6969423.1 NnrT protein [Cereibacter sphaeroides]MCE6975481.1 NnrT protein [Cereibacter sphaeroides]